MMRHRWTWLLALALCGCFKVDVPNGGLKCAADKSCPSGYQCVENACWKGGLVVGGGHDMSVGGGSDDMAGAGGGDMAGAPPVDMAINLALCDDKKRDGDETDIDCGGSCPNKCGADQICRSNADCTSTFCNPGTHLCGPFHCVSGAKDGDESDVDCGGPACAPCEVDRACTKDDDCATTTCADKLCGLASGPPFWTMANAGNGPSVVDSNVVKGSDGKWYYASIWDNPGIDDYSSIIYSIDPVSGNAVANSGITASYGSAVCFAITSDSTQYIIGNGQTVAYHGTTQVTPALAQMPSPTASHACALGNDGKIYVFAGTLTGTGAFTPQVAIFDPKGMTGTAPGSWTSTTETVTAAIDRSAAVARDGTIYAVGGLSGAGSASVYHGEVEARKPGSTFKAVAPLNVGRYSAGAVEGADGRIWVVGGYNGPTENKVVEAYSPGPNHWFNLTGAPLNRGHDAVVLLPDGRLWAFGGSTSVEWEFYGPTASATPTSVAAGGKLSVTGSNFAANAIIDVFLDGTTGSPPLTSGTSDGTGVVKTPINVTLPTSASAGSHTLVVKDRRSRYPITIALTVTP